MKLVVQRVKNASVDVDEKTAKPEIANELYEYFCNKCKGNGLKVEKGIFGADMKVKLINDGPVTIILEK